MVNEPHLLDFFMEKSLRRPRAHGRRRPQKILVYLESAHGVLSIDIRGLARKNFWRAETKWSTKLKFSGGGLTPNGAKINLCG